MELARPPQRAHGPRNGHPRAHGSSSERKEGLRRGLLLFCPGGHYPPTFTDTHFNQNHTNINKVPKRTCLLKKAPQGSLVYNQFSRQTELL